MTRIVFMGSPRFAVPTLEALVDAYQVVGVVTQPDRPAGRGSRLRPPAVKVAAEAHALPMFQPQSLDVPEALTQLEAWDPDVIVVVAFGQLLPPPILDLPPHGCLNIHASLLPRWRGPAPVTAALMAGDGVTGVTVMRMDEGLDTGPIIAQREEPIRPQDTAKTLTRRLAQMGAELLIDTLPPYLAGELEPRPQAEEKATYSCLLTKEDGRLDWSRPAVELDRQIRAVTPWPGAFTTCQGRRLKILRAEPLPDWEAEGPPGMVVCLDDGAAVITGEGALKLLKVQLAGRKALPIEPFLCGQRDFIGADLGSESAE